MKTPNPDVDCFIEALRGDLPNAEDEARVRSRLLSAGVLVTSAAVTTSGAAASVSAATVTSGVALSGTTIGGAALGAQVAGTAGAPLVLVKAGLVSKLLLLPVAAKVGVATSLALAVAATSAPLIVSRAEAPAVVAPANPAAPSRHGAPANVPHAAPSVNAAPVSQWVPSDEEPPVSFQPVPPRTLQAPSTPERAQPVRRETAQRESAARESAARETAQRETAQRETAPAQPAPTRRVGASSLAEETRLMERAMLAAGAGQHELARRWLDEHTRRFPEGLLARERERALARLPEAGAPEQTSSP